MMSGIPLPKVVADVGPGGPLVTSLGGINALEQSNAQAKYAPYQAYGNAFLTNQQATWLPYQYRMQALSNPLLWIAAQKNQGLQDTLNNLVANPMTGIGSNTPNIPQPGQILGNLGNALLQKIGLGSSNQSPQGNTQNALGMPSMDSAQSGGTFSSGEPRSPQPLPGTGVKPNIYTQTKQTEAEAGAQGQANIDLWKNSNDAVAKAAIEAQDTLNDKDRLVNAYKNLGNYEKGVIFGHGPALTSNAQVADQASSSLRASVLRQIQQGHITNKDVTTFGMIKPDRTLNPEAMDQVSDFMEGAAKRAQEHAAFNNNAQNIGLTSPQADLIWTKYINDRPFYDAKNKQLNQKNLNTWSDYLKQDKMNSILSGSTQSQNSSSGIAQSNNNMWPSGKEPINANDPAILGKASPPNTKWMIRPDGIQVPVHNSRMKEARKLNYRGINE